MYQLVTIVGNLGRDPEMRYLADGTPVTNFSVATNETWTDNEGQRQERTTWFRVSVFGRQAETANEYLYKGRQVLVEGRLNSDPTTGGPRVYTRQDGTVGAQFELRARLVRFMGKREAQDNGSEEPGAAAEIDENNMPF